MRGKDKCWRFLPPYKVRTIHFLIKCSNLFLFTSIVGGNLQSLSIKDLKHLTLSGKRVRQATAHLPLPKIIAVDGTAESSRVYYNYQSCFAHWCGENLIVNFFARVALLVRFLLFQHRQCCWWTPRWK